MQVRVSIAHVPKNTLPRIAANISATANTTTSSGRTLIPWVSSSKKRSSPALAAGMGALFSRFLDRLILARCPISFQIRASLTN